MPAKKPAAAKKTAPKAAAARKTAPKRAAAQVKKPRAVICDDDAMTRSIERSVLERAGYDVMAEVGTAIEALQLCLNFRPDVLLLDLVLPAMSGEDVIPAINTGAPDTTIIIVSSFDPSAAVHAGARFVVPKTSNKELESLLVTLAARPRRSAS